ncbi:helix-turn-helix domain-containing protein [Streptomyces sp. NPDC093568]|uniref:helix-turn-helix domain-containing protein n=1 Tax=Streptomyces sp. NPDC093568 TaxID=3366041 RepID=UPI003813E7B9
MNGTTTVAHTRWRALHVRKRTLGKGVHTLTLPPSTGIGLSVHVSGILAVHGGRRDTRETILLPEDVCVTPAEPNRPLVVSPRGNRPAVIASLTIPEAAVRRLLGEEFRMEERQSPHPCPAVTSDPVLAEMVKAVVAAGELGADDVYADSAARFILAHLRIPWSHAAAAKEPGGSLTQEQLETITSYMRANFALPITLDDLAALVSFSRFHFLRCFKNATGATPYRYLTELRIASARTHLENGTETIAAIGQRCGFSGSEHFSRSFRRVMGCTPSQYRAMRSEAHVARRSPA